MFKSSVFSHRLGVSYDFKSQTLILFAQFVNTMPWVFVIENVVPYSKSVSILYSKALLDGTDELLTLDYAFLDVHKIKWRMFPVPTEEARKFAQRKWLQEIIAQRSRAHYEYDLRIDDILKERVPYFINQSFSHSKTPEIDAIVKLMEEKYQESQQLKTILDTTRIRARELWDNGSFNGIVRDQKVLDIYRECLKDIKNKFGYPAIYVDLG